jgi:serine/threonine-protein kinase
VENREPVRYPSPRPDGAQRAVSPRRGSSAVGGRPATPAPVAPRRPGSAIVLEPDHLASLTAAQREDLRLWHGRVHLFDRIKAMRGYMWLTIGVMSAGLTLFGIGLTQGIPPAILIPIVPGYMSLKLWRRGKSLRESGLRLRRVLLMPRARWVLPAPAAVPTEQQLEKLASREILESAHGAAIRRAVEDRAAILDIVASLSKPDRALLPDIEPTVKALVERVAELAQTLHRLEQGFDPRLILELGARIADDESGGESLDGERRLALLRRQRATLEELVQRRTLLERQLESAGLALGNLRLDLIKFRSSGLQSALSDVSTATHEARALSRDIVAALEAVADVKGL